ncbi:MAG: acetolactate synthase small subunit [Acidimicrobiales bacterium]
MVPTGTTETNASSYHTLVVLVENKPGVLARVAGLFARRGFNIHSLAVAPTEDDRVSRITIWLADTASVPVEQIVKQLYKLIHVVKINELAPADSVEQELLMATVKAAAGVRTQILELTQIFGGKVLNTGATEMMVRLAGSPKKLDDFEELLGPSASAIQRTGQVALPPSRPGGRFSVAGGRWHRHADGTASAGPVAPSDRARTSVAEPSLGNTPYTRPRSPARRHPSCSAKGLCINSGRWELQGNATSTSLARHRCVTGPRDRGRCGGHRRRGRRRRPVHADRAELRCRGRPRRGCRWPRAATTARTRPGSPSRAPQPVSP